MQTSVLIDYAPESNARLVRGSSLLTILGWVLIIFGAWGTLGGLYAGFTARQELGQSRTRGFGAAVVAVLVFIAPGLAIMLR